MAGIGKQGLYAVRKFDDFRLIDYQYKPNLESPIHRDKYPRISILLSGALKESTRKEDAWGTSMSVVIKPPDIWHANQYGPKGTRIISIQSKWKDKWPDYLDASFLSRYQWFHGIRHTRATIKLLTELSHTSDQFTFEQTFINLLANLTQDLSIPKGEPPKWLSMIAQQLEDCCDQSLQVQTLARSADVHPVYLARIFRHYFNCSPKDYQHQFRMKRAIAQLTDPSPIVQVALNNGFADQSHFSRLFKANAGMSPGNFKKLIQSMQRF